MWILLTEYCLGNQIHQGQMDKNLGRVGRNVKDTTWKIEV